MQDLPTLVSVKEIRKQKRLIFKCYKKYSTEEKKAKVYDITEKCVNKYIPPLERSAHQSHDIQFPKQGLQNCIL